MVEDDGIKAVSKVVGDIAEAVSSEVRQISAKAISAVKSHGDSDFRLELRELGDRQVPTEPNRGFRIQSFDHQLPPTPVEIAIPRFPIEENHLIREFAKQCLDGTIPVDKKPVLKPHMSVTFRIKASDFRRAIAEGRVGSDVEELFSKSSLVEHTRPGAEALEALVDDNSARAVLEEAARPNHSQISATAIDELKYLRPETDSFDEATADITSTGIHSVNQAYEFSDGQNRIRMIDFSGNGVDEEHLRHIANTLRSINEKSEGGLFERLNTIAVIPREHPALATNKTIDGIPIHAGAQQYGRSIFLSDRILENATEGPEYLEANKYLDSLRLPDEPTEEFGGPPRRVGGEFDQIVAHELGHAAILPGTEGQELLQSFTPPTLYGRSKDERMAELVAAEFTGGSIGRAIPARQYELLQQVWEESSPYKPNFGPRFVVARQLDSTRPLPLRFRFSERSPLRVKVTYELDHSS